MSDQARAVCIEQLLAYALAIEQEAAERYAELADQMAVHNNAEVAALFRKLADIEAKHVANVETLSEGRKLPTLTLWDEPWHGAESPEATARDEVHYLMTPHHALSLALAGERRATAFFARMAEEAGFAELRHLAQQLHDDEQEHVRLIEEWLARYPEPEEGWDEDLDPPAIQE